MKSMNQKLRILSLATLTVWVLSAGTLVVSAASGASISQSAAPQAPPAPATPPPTPRAPTAPRIASGYGVGVGMGSGSYLGVDVQEVTSDRVSTLKLKEERGVEIVMVDQDAPAGKAGFKEHDVILDFNGNRVEGQEQLVRMLHETPAGRQVTLGIMRDGQPMQIPVTLGERRKSAHYRYRSLMPAMPAIPPMPPMPDFDIPAIEVIARSYSRSAGMMVDNLTPQLGEFFGVKSGQGVLVRSVEKGSAAEVAGLKAGDIIVKVDSEKISDRNDFSRALRNRNGAKLALGVVREKREQTLTLTLPERRSKNESRLWPGFDGDLSDFDFEMDFDSSELKHLKEEMPKIQRELERLGPQLRREIERVREQVNRTVSEQYFTPDKAQAQTEKAAERKMKTRQMEKVKSGITALKTREI